MKVAIMQPYFFPYIGYFQLINTVDKFVFLDDVNFIKKGWINRNNICLNGSTHLLTIPLIKPSQNKLICETEISIDSKEIDSVLQTVNQAYSKSKFKENMIDILNSTLTADFKLISDVNKHGITSVCEYLGIQTEIIDSSSIFNNSNLKGEDRILDICLQLKANSYINPIGGVELYKNERFEGEGIDLLFLQKDSTLYKQPNTNFIDNLSIIDVIANVDSDLIKSDLLNRMHYER